MTLTLLEWLAERRDNCLRLADGHDDKVRRGWIEDAQYFQAAIDAIAARPAGTRSGGERMDLSPTKMEKAAVIAEIDGDELALRLMEAYGSMEIPRHGLSATETLELVGGPFPAAFRRAAQAAMLYWRECIAASRRPS